jgi:NADH-quinone oxidoreductase subunit N
LQACLMLVALLSLAGIPLTAGFIGKFYLFSAAVTGNNWVILAALIVGSAIGIYYYLRVVYYMTRRQGQQPSDYTAASGTPQYLLPSILIAVILFLGTLPEPLMAYIASIL